ncbi:MAG: low molecular weight phosphotyrosine protein phosphatase [Sinobacteraceae bacterium]|nr:low molecular weight phosphotyrosine protein phosphatase [Planctomycetota bacterium]MCP5467629.1 low molecular weight phosphotyrosine protein phosphatase [Nevskiaceae bacterium]
MVESSSVLFVCMGNICRSPTAHGVFAHVLAAAQLGGRVVVDSAATHDYHPGSPPDPRSQEAAARRGYDLSSLRARAVRSADFDRFDLVLAMDHGNRRELLRRCPPDRQDRVRMFLSFAPQLGIDEVPDPYYGPGDGFERVLDMVEAGAEGLLVHLRTRLGV